MLSVVRKEAPSGSCLRDKMNWKSSIYANALCTMYSADEYINKRQFSRSGTLFCNCNQLAQMVFDGGKLTLFRQNWIKGMASMLFLLYNWSRIWVRLKNSSVCNMKRSLYKLLIDWITFLLFIEHHRFMERRSSSTILASNLAFAYDASEVCFNVKYFDINVWLRIHEIASKSFSKVLCNSKARAFAFRG